MNKTKFAPAAIFPLPMHHGLTVFMLSVTALVAVYFIGQMFVGQREMF